MVTLIQLNCIERKSARLTINSQGKEAVIFFENGEISHAQYAEHTGTKAVHQALAISDGYFRLEEGILPHTRTNKLPWMQVVMEGIRLLDEQRAHADKRPIEERVVEELTTIKGVGWVLLTTSDGSIVAHSGLQTPERISALMAFFCAKGQAIGGKLKLGRTQQLALTCSDNQVVMLFRESYIVALLLDSRSSLETIIEEATGTLRRHFPERVPTA